MKKNILIFIFYLTASLILTYPLVKYLDRSVYSASDSLHSTWLLDRNVYSLFHQPLKEFFNANSFYPHQNTLAYSDHLIGETIFALPFLLLFANPILAQNILILFSFALSGLSAFLLVNYWLKNKTASLIAGFAFAFSNFRFQQLDHLNILSSQWLPLVFLYLQKWLDSQKRKDLSLLGLFYLLTILNTLHYALMITFAVVMYLIFYFLFFKPKSFQSSQLLPLASFFLICFLIFLPFLLPYLKFKQDFPQIGWGIKENMAGSASLASLFFSASSTRIARLTWFENVSEADAGLWPGFTFLVLFILGLRKIKEKDKKAMLFFLFLTIFFFIFSFGPVLRFARMSDTSLPLPYLIFYLLLPFFRVMRTPVRWYLFSLLFACFFVAWGVKFLIKEDSKIKKFLVALILVLISLESFSVPLHLVLVPKKNEFPPVYQWLSQQPGDFAILELPIPKITDTSSFQNKKHPYSFLRNLTPHEFDTIENYRLYFSTLHRKKMVNGYAAFFPPIYLRIVERSQNFSSEDFLEVIKPLRVKYIIIHQEQLTENQKEKDLPLLLENNKLNLVKEFDSQDYVFSLK